VRYSLILRRLLRLSIYDAQVIVFIFSTKIIILRSSLVQCYFGEVQPL